MGSPTPEVSRYFKTADRGTGVPPVLAMPELTFARVAKLFFVPVSQARAVPPCHGGHFQAASRAIGHYTAWAIALSLPLLLGAGPADTGGPALPGDPTWAGVVVIIAIALFGAAAFVGPVVLSQMPEEMPPTHSHDEPPGSSGHHGPLGEAESISGRSS